MQPFRRLNLVDECSSRQVQTHKEPLSVANRNWLIMGKHKSTKNGLKGRDTKTKNGSGAVLLEENYIGGLSPLELNLRLSGSQSDRSATLADCKPYPNSQSSSPIENACIRSRGISGGHLDPSNSELERIAPRSGSQFKIGPSFLPTEIENPLYCFKDCNEMIPKISSRVDRGFQRNSDHEWIGYKRNYFTLVTAFEFENATRDEFIRESYFVVDENGNPNDVRFLALRLISKCCEDNTMVTLVQHTAKRDKGPQTEPQIYPAIPGSLPAHETIKDAANIRNCNKIVNYNKLFYLAKDSMDDEFDLEDENSSILNTYPDDLVSIAARYERIQFSSSINCRKYSMVNRHFVLGVQLLAVLNDGTSVVVAHSYTPPLIVRGRSPSNYLFETSRKEQQVHKRQRKRTKESPWIDENRILQERTFNNLNHGLQPTFCSNTLMRKIEKGLIDYGIATHAWASENTGVEYVVSPLGHDHHNSQHQDNVVPFDENRIPRSLNFFENEDPDLYYEDGQHPSELYKVSLGKPKSRRHNKRKSRSLEMEPIDFEETGYRLDLEAADEEDGELGDLKWAIEDDDSFFEFQQDLQNARRKFVD